MSTDDLKIINTRKLAKSLALGIEDRGPHATGVAFRTPSGSSPIQIHKAPVCATDFIKRMPMPRSAQVGLIHTRFATQGHPDDNNNNHPLYNAGIVGVHNGHVTNDNELFNLVYEAGGQRHGEVDSEAIFAAIAWNVARWPSKGDPSLGDVLEGVRGGAAVAWLDESDPTDVLHISRLNQSPLVMSWTPGGSLIFASTAAAIKEAAAAVGVDITHSVYVVEGVKYTVVAGAIASKIEFQPAWRSQYDNRRYYSSGGYTTVTKGKSMVEQWEDKWGDIDDSSSLPAPIPLPAVGRADGPAATSARTLCQVVADMEEDNTYYDLTDDLVSPLSIAKLTNHWDQYKTRENAISEFRDSFTTTVPSAKADIMYKMHAYDRVGTWVNTQVQGVDTYGQIYEMPQTFPSGHYVLRVVAYNEERPDSEEWVMVARRHTEFVRCEDQTIKSRGDIAATEALNAKLEAAAEVEGTAPPTGVDDDELMLEWSMAGDNA